MGEGARLWLIEAASGTTRMRVKMAEALSLAKLFDPVEVDWALGHPAVHGRFAEADQGKDSLSGGSGADTLRGDLGDDVIAGGSGTDKVLHSGIALPVRVDLRYGTSKGHGSDKLSSIEVVHGSSRNDVLIGSSRANVLAGQGGNDLIKGLGGPDRLFGNAGADRLEGGAGNDFRLF